MPIALLRPRNLLCLLAVVAAASSASLGSLLAAGVVLAIVSLQFVLRRHLAGAAPHPGAGARGAAAAIPWGNGSPS